MLEALGMQILHTEIGYEGGYYEAHFSAGWPDYIGSMSAADLKSTAGAYDYSVDFFLYDPRTALDVLALALELEPRVRLVLGPRVDRRRRLVPEADDEEHGAQFFFKI